MIQTKSLVALLLCLFLFSTCSIAQDKQKAAAEKATEAITDFHVGLLKDDAKSKRKAIDKYSPTEADFKYLFGKEDGPKLFNEHEKILKKLKAQVEEADDLKGLEVESVEVMPLKRDKTTAKAYGYLDKLPKDVFVFEFSINFVGGGGAGGGCIIVYKKRAFVVKEFEFSIKYKEFMKSKKK